MKVQLLKSRRLLCLALILSGLPFATQRAFGLAAIVQINQTNIKTDYSFLQVKTGRFPSTNGEARVVFTVLVVPKTKDQQPMDFSGVLRVREGGAGQGEIVSAEVRPRKISHKLLEQIPASLRAKAVMFEFTVAETYLTASSFTVEETSGEFDSSPGIYWFYLKEFPMNTPPGSPIGHRSDAIHDAVTVLTNSASALGLLHTAMPQLKGATVLSTVQQPVTSIKEALQVVPEVQKIAPRPILAVTEYHGWFWFGMDRMDGGGVDELVAGSGWPFIDGYAINKDGRNIVYWSMW